MKYGYCRVSTKGQLEGNSIEEQTEKIKALYSDAEIIIESYSGAKERPIFNSLIAKLKPGDTLVVTKLDRFCRTAKEGLQFIDAVMEKGAQIHVLNMGLFDNTPMGRLLVTCLLAFAEFERAMIIERTQGGKEIAKQKPDFREGRPKKHMPQQLGHALDLLADHSYKEVAQMTGISKSTLVRAKRISELANLEKEN
jgi:DNA invertase Pin-like site-specific DNA recombinase